MDEESDSNDRVSQLPDHLLLSILLLLPITDVIGTTLLSKRWNGLWTTLPCLEFDGDPDYLDEFRDIANGVISLWKGTKILKFSVAVCFDSYRDWLLYSNFDSWVRFAVEKQVEELCLNLMCLPTDSYCPPQILYLCSSIKKLTLVSCILKIDKNVEWNQLLSLTIEVAGSFCDDAMDRILCGAPRLEVLELQLRHTNENLNIRSSSLKNLIIRRFRNPRHDEGANEAMLRIWAPNLDTLEISGVPCIMCLLSVPSLTNVILGFYEGGRYKTDGDILLDGMLRQVYLSVNHVEKITLSHWCIKVLLELKKKDMVAWFSNARSLEFEADAAEEILGVVEMFPKLMMMVVEHNHLTALIINYDLNHCVTGLVSNMAEDSFVFKFDSCKLSEPKPSLLHLRTVEVTWYTRDTSIFGVLECILENAEMLEKMVFWPRPELLSMAEEMVLSMPRSSPTAEVIIRR